MTAKFMFIVFTLFCAGAIAVPLASRYGLGSILGYLIAGIAIAPILGVVGVDVVALQHFTEFGVVMMLFLIGLEMQPKVLWQMRARIFLMGGAQVVLTTALAMGIAMLFDLGWTVALAIGLILALSSTAIVSQTLNEKGLMRSDGGQASFSVLLFQDIAVIPMLAFIPLLALPELQEALLFHETSDGHGSDSDLHLNVVENLPLWASTLVTLGAIAAVVLAGKYLTSPVLRYVARAKLRELFVSTALMLVVGIALLMTMVGLSPALGTFLAGVVMANSEFRHELESDIAPFKGIFLGVFFITVGASIDFNLLANNVTTVVGLTLGLVLLKIGVIWLISYLFSVKGANQWLFAMGLAQAGEFGFVLVSFTVANAVLPADTADMLLVVIAMSMMLTPLLFVLYDKVVAPRFAREQAERQADEIDHTGAKVIIAGHGRFGGIVNRVLEETGIKPVVVDYSDEQLALLRKFGLQVYFGDATRPDLLEAAGIDNAKVLVVAIDDRDSINDLVSRVVKEYPHVEVIARAVNRTHVYELWSLGCRNIIRETYDSSLRTARSTLEALDIPRAKAEAIVQEFDQSDRKFMIESAPHYDVSVSAAENHDFVRFINENSETWRADVRARIAAILARDETGSEAGEEKDSEKGIDGTQSHGG